MATTLIRPARPQDAGTILALVRDLAVYEKHPAEVVQMTEAGLLEHCFGPTPSIEVLLAKLDGTARRLPRWPGKRATNKAFS